MIICSHYPTSWAVRTRWSWRGDTHMRYSLYILATAAEFLELVLHYVLGQMWVGVWHWAENMNKAAGCLHYPNLPLTFTPVATKSQTCLLVSGYFTVIPSWIVTMHAEEEIKNQVVDSHQSKAWHTANSLRSSSLSFPHKYLPCVTLPFLRLLTCHVACSWVPCSSLTPRPPTPP